MKNVIWAVQNNLGNPEDIERLSKSLDFWGIQKQLIKAIPFSDELPDVPNDKPVFFYGSTTLTKNVAASDRWKPGVFFDNERFSFPSLKNGFGKNLLNFDSEVLSIRELVAKNFSLDEVFFIRPSSDMKEFAGSLMEFSEILEWKTRLVDIDGPLSFDTLVQIAKPKHIDREWRTIVVDKKVVTASQYKKDSKLNTTDSVPSHVIDFANSMAQTYQPAPVFVLDICEAQDGLFVVETNCVNSSGYYQCDYCKIVQSISNYIERIINE